MTNDEKAEKVLNYLKGDYDVMDCEVCGEPIVVSVMTGEPQCCQRLECVYTTLVDQL